jgi:PiT family inorganic phosphate transporter
MFGLDPTLTALLLFCLILACAFEFINGFHDTANAVATVIYTNSLKPWVAVIWSGIWNAIGVFAGGIAVAMGISNLLPVEVLTDTEVAHNVALILSLLISAIAWNLGTWYFGIPCSSSHTLVGSILGVGMAFSIMSDDWTFKFVNWSKASDIGLSLLFSPLIGFSLAVILMYILRQVVRKKTIFKEPNTTAPPPTWIRVILLLTCTSVSFSHGSNDGQKGVGLMMLILIAIVPIRFALNHDTNLNEYNKSIEHVGYILNKIDQSKLNGQDTISYASVNKNYLLLSQLMKGKENLSELTATEQFAVRKDIIVMGKSTKKLIESPDLNLSMNDKSMLKYRMKKITALTEYSPSWVILMIAISLGLGTMVGWKRIVKTIGEKIGKQHLTYAQGASSEMVAAGTIGISTWLGLPVSTTQVLSSGIAGSMVASKGIKNLQSGTIRTIFIAWILTLPVTVLMSGLLYILFRNIL